MTQNPKSDTPRFRELALALVIAMMLFTSARGATQVFCAAGIAPAVEQIAEAYQRKTGQTVRVNPASSSTLARQIEMGAPADIFISAHPKWIEYLRGRRAIEPSTITTLATCHLVLVAPRGQPKITVTLSKDFAFPESFTGRIAMGDPAHVPAGVYATQALEHFGWMRPLQARVLPAESVTAAAKLVQLGEAPVGIVYAPNATAASGLDVLAVFPDDSHDPIQFTAALCRGADAGNEAFLTYLRTDADSGRILRQFGFEHGTRSAAKR